MAGAIEGMKIGGPPNAPMGAQPAGPQPAPSRGGAITHNNTAAEAAAHHRASLRM
jgi:hypothetical protein